MWFGLYVYCIYIHISTLPPRHCPVRKFFSQTRIASERFYWPGGNRFAFQMSWSPKRRDSETLATAWTLRLSTCMASKHKQHTHTNTHSHILSCHTLISLNLSISVVSVSDHTPATTHYIPFKYTKYKTKQQNNNTMQLH